MKGITPHGVWKEESAGIIENVGPAGPVVPTGDAAGNLAPDKSDVAKRLAEKAPTWRKSLP
jgi:hypothetical protein